MTTQDNAVESSSVVNAPGAKRRTTWRLTLAILLGATACDSLGTRGSIQQSPPGTGTEVNAVNGTASTSPDFDGSARCAMTHGYPPGRWRLNPSSLNNVAFNLRRIVIAHREQPVTLGSAFPVQEHSRTREEALTLARTLSCELARDPGLFAELARRHSDDANSENSGGALGIVRATMIAEQVVDALNAVPVGSVSRLVDTAEGYQIVQRLQVPRAQFVSAESILVGHPTSAASADGTLATSSGRTKALALAKRIARQAANNPSSFTEMVARHSENPAVVSSGDFGQHSTHEASSDALIIRTIASLKIGEVSPVIESVRGFGVFRRTANHPRPTLSMSEIVIPHKRGQPTHDDGAVSISDRRATRRLARKVLKEAQSNPALFADLQRRHCALGNCDSPPSVFVSGAVAPAIEKALIETDFNEVASTLVETPTGYHVIRRESVATHVSPEETLSYQVPTPELRNFTQFLRDAPGQLVAQIARKESQGFANDEQLGATRRAGFENWLTEYVAALSTSRPTERSAVVEDSEQALAALLGADSVARYRRYLDTRVLEEQKKFLQGMGVPL